MRKKWWLNIALSLITFLSFYLMARYMRQAENFPIRAVEIHGQFDKTQHGEIKSALHDELLRGFFSVDIQTVHKALLQLPWVAQVSVKRVWPDRLRVQLKEHTALVRFNDRGVLSEKGVLFYPSQIDTLVHLPLLRGPSHQAAEMLEHFQVAQALLEPLNLSVAELQLQASGPWTIKLEHHMELFLGQQAFAERLQRFVKAAEKQLQPHFGAIRYVDLRYTNGLALGWKPNMSRPILSSTRS